MIKLKDILYEIGDASTKPFKYKLIAGDWADEYKEGGMILLYEFTTDKGTVYNLTIDIDDGNDGNRSINAEIDFSTKTAGGEVSMDDTNLGEQYRVMATIKDIVIEFIEEWSKKWYIDKIEISPIKSSDGGDDDVIDAVDSRRGKLYLAYIRKALIPNLSKPHGVRVFSHHFLIQPYFDNPFE
jgi:hypothetical protein